MEKRDNEMAIVRFRSDARNCAQKGVGIMSECTGDEDTRHVNSPASANTKTGNAMLSVSVKQY